MECNEMVARHSALKEKCRNLLSVAKPKSKEVQLLKIDVDPSKESIGALQ